MIFFGNYKFKYCFFLFLEIDFFYSQNYEEFVLVF